VPCGELYQRSVTDPVTVKTRRQIFGGIQYSSHDAFVRFFRLLLPVLSGVEEPPVLFSSSLRRLSISSPTFTLPLKTHPRLVGMHSLFSFLHPPSSRSKCGQENVIIPSLCPQSAEALKGEGGSVWACPPKPCLSCLSRRSLDEGGSEVEGRPITSFALPLNQIRALFHNKKPQKKNKKKSNSCHLAACSHTFHGTDIASY